VYRHHLPRPLKAHLSHDVLLLCHACHERYEQHADRLKAEIAAKMGVDQPPPSLAPLLQTFQSPPPAISTAGPARSENASQPAALSAQSWRLAVFPAPLVRTYKAGRVLWRARTGRAALPVARIAELEGLLRPVWERACAERKWPVPPPHPIGVVETEGSSTARHEAHPDEAPGLRPASQAPPTAVPPIEADAGIPTAFLEWMADKRNLRTLYDIQSYGAAVVAKLMADTPPPSASAHHQSTRVDEGGIVDLAAALLGRAGEVMTEATGGGEATACAESPQAIPQAPVARTIAELDALETLHWSVCATSMPRRGRDGQ